MLSDWDYTARTRLTSALEFISLDVLRQSPEIKCAKTAICRFDPTPATRAPHKLTSSLPDCTIAGNRASQQTLEVCMGLRFLASMSALAVLIVTAPISAQTPKP